MDALILASCRVFASSSASFLLLLSHSFRALYASMTSLTPWIANPTTPSAFVTPPIALAAVLTTPFRDVKAPLTFPETTPARSPSDLRRFIDSLAGFEIPSAALPAASLTPSRAFSVSFAPELSEVVFRWIMVSASAIQAAASSKHETDGSHDRQGDHKAPDDAVFDAEQAALWFSAILFHAGIIPPPPFPLQVPNHPTIV